MANKKQKFPEVIRITCDPNANGEEENLLAWKSLAAADSGLVATYHLGDVVEKREAVEVRRQGTKTWFKVRETK